MKYRITIRGTVKYTEWDEVEVEAGSPEEAQEMIERGEIESLYWELDGNEDIHFKVEEISDDALLRRMLANAAEETAIDFDAEKK